MLNFKDDLLVFALTLAGRKNSFTVFRFHYDLSIHFTILYLIDHSYFNWNHPVACFEKSGEKLETYQEDVNKYCWTHGIYNVTKEDLTHEILPGVGGFTGSQDTTTQHFYMWTYFYILVMVILLKIPMQFWQSILNANGRVRTIARELKRVSFLNSEDLEREADSLAEYLHHHIGYQYHFQFAYGFVLAEILNVVVGLFLMLFWDFITGDEFSMHGAPPITVLLSKLSEITNRLEKVFPAFKQCTFNIHGPSGDLQPRDFICIMHLNIINERAAVLFWYNYMFLAAVGVIALIIRFGLILSRRMRRRLFCRLTPLTSLVDVEIILDRCSYCDFFIIQQLGSIVGPRNFAKIMRKLAEKSCFRI